MKNYKLLTLALTFFAFQEIPAQVTFTSETRLIVVNVSVKDKMGQPITNLKKEDFEITEDAKKQDIEVFEFEKLNNDLLTPVPDEEGGPKQLEQRVAAPKPAAVAPAAKPTPAAITSGGLATSQRKDKRLMAMFFDMTTMPQFDQIRAQENAIKFVREQMTSSDLVQIMVYGNKLNVVEEFTDDREKLVTDLKNLVIGTGADLAGAAATAGAEGDDSGAFTQDDTEFNIFNTDRQLAAIEDAVKMLAAFPEKKALIYFSSGIPKNGIDNQSQLRAATNAAIRANVSIYSVDSRGLQASAPAGDATQSSRGTGSLSGSTQTARVASQQDTQETLATLSADTGGKVMLDNNDLTMGFKAAQTDMTSYYIIGYYSKNSAPDGKYRHIKMRLTNPQLASSTKALEYKEGYYANKVFQKFTAADKEQQLQEALTLGDPLSDLPLALEADYFRVAQNRYFVPISVKIPGSEVALAKKTSTGIESTDFDFVGVVKDAAGKSLATLPQWATTGVRDNIKIDLKGKDAAQLEKRPLQYDTGLTLPPGNYLIRFLVRENQTGKMGTFETKFLIPDLNTEKTLRLSSVIYSSQKDPIAAAVGSAVNDKKALSADPLIQDGQKIVPSITGVFRKDQNMYVYFEVYDPSPDDQKAPNVAAEVDLYRGARKVYTSAPLQVTKLSTARPGLVPFSFQIPLAKIATGQYTAQVTVIDETGKKFAFPRRAVIILPEQNAAAATPAPAAQPNQ